jgi:hypothetical protein
MAISKQGYRYVRRILVVGAHAILRYTKQSAEKYPWGRPPLPAALWFDRDLFRSSCFTTPAVSRRQALLDQGRQFVGADPLAPGAH